MLKLFFKIVGTALNLASFIAPKWAEKWTIQLFITPRRHPIRQKELDFLHTARQVHAEIDGISFVEYHWGEPDAPLVLLSYGWEYNAGRWRHFVPPLVEFGFRVIAYDPPGHGLAPDGEVNLLTNATIIRHLIRCHGTPEAIVAHSFGGSSAVFALSEMPRWYHPRRMVIMASFSYAPRIFREYALLLGLRRALYYRVVRTFEQRASRRFDEFDFARMTSDFDHIRGLLVHSPSDDITPLTETQRFFNFWKGAALYTPHTGGHHLGSTAITRVILSFVTDGSLPKHVEIQHNPLSGRHDLARHFAGM